MANQLSSNYLNIFNIKIELNLNLYNKAIFYYFIHRYLQEIGYTDKVLDMRSARVRSLLGITTDDLPADNNENILSARENRSRKSEYRHHVAENENTRISSK